MRTRTSLLLALILCAETAVEAQDNQLSQYDAAAIMLNPALTGMYENSDFRASCNVRSQWNSLATNFLTTAFAMDMSFERRFGAGVYLNNYNMAGVMNTFQGGVTGSYNVSGEKAKHTLSAGLNLGVIYKKVNDQRLIWDAQYDENHFNADLPTGESFQKVGRLIPELGIGMAYRSVDANKSVNPFGNFALFHVTTPDESIFREEQSDLPIRYSVNGGVRISTSGELDLIPQGLYMRQGADQLIQIGLLGELTLLNGVYSVLAGVSYRVDDAAIAQVGLKHKACMYRFSYDVNVSPLKAYTHNNGAFEFSIVYYGTLSGRERRFSNTTF